MNLFKKKVIVTGADGFIGSHLVELLVEQGCQVKAFVYYNSWNTWGWLDNISKSVLNSLEIIVGDIRDADIVRQALIGCDVVFHLAALIAIPYSYYSPRSYIDTNVIGTLNVLQGCRDASIERIIITSTSEVYGTAMYVPIDEQHPLQGQSPYSASKIAADKLAESFYRSFNLPIVTVRPFNTYGPRQSARAVIPSIISQLISGKEKIKLGDITPRRDFTYILDTVQGFIELAKTEMAIGKTINIATNSEYSIKEITDILISEINPKAEIITESSRLRPKNSEVYRLFGDNSLIKQLTSWQPKFDIKEGIKKTIKWFENSENRRLYKEYIYNI
jgi:NAD dependent epimerase/dehydratase